MAVDSYLVLLHLSHMHHDLQHGISLFLGSKTAQWLSGSRNSKRKVCFAAAYALRLCAAFLVAKQEMLHLHNVHHLEQSGHPHVPPAEVVHPNVGSHEGLWIIAEATSW